MIASGMPIDDDPERVEEAGGDRFADRVGRGERVVGDRDAGGLVEEVEREVEADRVGAGLEVAPEVPEDQADHDGEHDLGDDRQHLRVAPQRRELADGLVVAALLEDAVAVEQQSPGHVHDRCGDADGDDPQQEDDHRRNPQAFDMDVGGVARAPPTDRMLRRWRGRRRRRPRQTGQRNGGLYIRPPLVHRSLGCPRGSDRSASRFRSKISW